MHRIQRHVLWLVLIGAVALAMTGFGVDSFGPSRGLNKAVIVINDQEISAETLNREMLSVRSRYTQMFREKTDELINQLGINIESQARDSLIDKVLVEQEAKNLGLVASQAEVEGALRDQLASIGFDTQRFRAFLRQIGMSEEEFQAEIGKDVLRGYVASLITDAGRASYLETIKNASFAKAEFSAVGVEIGPKKFYSEIPTPSDAEIEKYYLDHESDFAIPAKIAFKVVAFTPEVVMEEVTVLPEDIEQYYVDHPAEFAQEPKATYEVFSVPVAKGADASVLSTLQDTAADVIKKLSEGSANEADAIKKSGFQKGKVVKLTKENQDATARAARSFAKVGFVPSPVIEETKISIVAVREFEVAEPRSLDAARKEIELKLKFKEAPAFAATKAADILASWGDGHLEDLSSIKGKKVEVLNVALTEIDGSGKAPLPATLVKSIGVKSAGETKFIVDEGAATYLVEIVDRRDSELKPLKDVKSEIVDVLKNNIAAGKVGELADKILAVRRANKSESLEAIATKNGLKVYKQAKLIANQQPSDEYFSNYPVAKFVTDARFVGALPVSPIRIADKAYVVEVTGIKAPELTPKNAAELEQWNAQATSNNTKVLFDAFIASAKAKAKIEVK